MPPASPTTLPLLRRRLQQSISLSRQPPRAYSTTHHEARKLNRPVDYNASTFLARSPKAALSCPEMPADVRTHSKTKRMNLHQAINSALAHILATDEKSVLFGEDVAFGGVFRVTAGLNDRFGGSRVFNTPLTEAGIVGFAVGLATSGYTAMPEIQFGDYVFPAFDQLHSEASTYRYRSGGVPAFNSGQLVVRMPIGAVGHGGIWHSQSPEGFFMGMQGVKVVIPRGPAQAKGLLIAASRCNDPVLFMEPKILYRAAVEDVPEEEYTLPIGKAQVVKSGDDLTIVSYGAMMFVAEQAAKAAKERLGVNCEVIDLRTIHPWDKETVTESVKKTGRCVVVHEASRSGGVGESVCAEVQERCFLNLEAPLARVTGWDVHMPFAYEQFTLPDVARIYDAIKKTVEF